MSIDLIGLGTALPEHRMSQSDALELTRNICCADERQQRLATVLFRRSGVQQRHTVVPHPIAYEYLSRADDEHAKGPTTRERMQMYADHAPPLAEAACRRALENAGCEGREITHLVTVSCTGFDAPGFDVTLFDTLPLRATTQRVQVGYMGCHGAINGLRVARGLAAEDPNATVLLCACELCSLHCRFDWDDERIIGNALFADGAAAVVLAGRRRVDRPGWSLAGTGSCLLPGSRADMSWRIGDHGFEMQLTSEVPTLIERHLRPWMSEWLGLHSLSIDEVSHWVIHPGGPRILDAAETALGLPKARTDLSREILSSHGNMSSPTVLFVLERLERQRPEGACVLLGFGPGLVAEAALLRRN